MAKGGGGGRKNRKRRKGGGKCYRTDGVSYNSSVCGGGMCVSRANTSGWSLVAHRKTRLAAPPMLPCARCVDIMHVCI